MTDGGVGIRRRVGVPIQKKDVHAGQSDIAVQNLFPREGNITAGRNVATEIDRVGRDFHVTCEITAGIRINIEIDDVPSSVGGFISREAGLDDEITGYRRFQYLNLARKILDHGIHTAIGCIGPLIDRTSGTGEDVMGQSSRHRQGVCAIRAHCLIRHGQIPAGIQVDFYLCRRNRRARENNVIPIDLIVIDRKVVTSKGYRIASGNGVSKPGGN